MLGRLLLAVLLCSAALLTGAGAAGAANSIITVTLASDERDDSDGTGGCEVDDEQPRGCTLRAAIRTANATPGEDLIEFALPAGATRIQPDTPLPAIADRVTIDGFSQPGAEPGEPVVELDGWRVGDDVPDVPGGGDIQYAGHWGLQVSASGSVVRGLAVHSFPNAEIGVLRANGVTVEGNWVGLRPSGDLVEATDNAVGIALVSSQGSVVGGENGLKANVVAGAKDAQVIVSPGTTSDSGSNAVASNRIGSTPAGAAAPGPGAAGIILTKPVGSETTTTQDLLIANQVTSQQRGIVLLNATATAVQRNAVGATVDGRAADLGGTPFGNARGVVVDRSTGAQVGGPEETDGNLLSGNDEVQLRVTGASVDTTVLDNLVGTAPTPDRTTDPTGRTLGADTGIDVTGNGAGVPRGTRIGSGDLTVANVVGGNDSGIEVRGGADTTRVEGNEVGGLADGWPLPNRRGIAVYGATPPAHVAVGSPGKGNVVLANALSGVEVQAGTDVGVQGNDVGVAKGGSLHGNATGIVVASPDVAVGGTAAGAANTVAGSTLDGIRITAAADRAQVVHNLVGGAGGNARYGIMVDRSEDRAPADARITDNTVLGNGYGIGVLHGTGTRVQGNRVGADPANGVQDGNEHAGVLVEADGTLVGGREAHDPNVIAATTGPGVQVLQAEDVRVEGNVIGETTGAGANTGAGVELDSGASGAVIGDRATTGCEAACNTIRGNGTGVRMTADAGRGNTVRGNHIRDSGGLDVDLEGAGPSADTVESLEDPAVVNAPVAVRVVHQAEGGIRVSGVVPPVRPGRSAAGVTVDVLAEPHADGARSADADVVATTTTAADGSWRVALPGPVAPAYGAIATHPDGSTSEPSVPCADRTGDADPDTDRDGLCENWETGGLDYDGDGSADVSLDQGTTTTRDLYLEVDRMATVALDDSTYEKVTTALAAGPDGGIAVHPLAAEHTGWVSELVPHREAVKATARGPEALDDVVDYVRGPRGAPCSGYAGTRAMRAAPDCAVRLGALRTVSRHALIADTIDPGTSGYADPAGRAFVVATGGDLASTTRVFTAGGVGRKACGSYPTCRAEMTAGTFMHELGHTLGLRHGGGDDVRFKPNYLSVMNYAFQWRNSVSDRPLDWSRRRMPDLDEHALDETRSILGSGAPWAMANGWARTSFAYLDQTGACSLFAQPVDESWNADGDAVLSTTARAAIHMTTRPESPGTPCRDAGELTQLRGFDDWAALSLAFPARDGWAQDAFGLPSARRAAAATAAAEPLASDLVRLGAQDDPDGDGVVNGEDNCTDTANAGQADGDDDGIGDACATGFPERDVAVALTGRRAFPAATSQVQTVTVANDYPEAATDVVVRVTADGLPATLGAPGAGTVDGDRWTVPSVPAHGKATLPVRVTGTTAGASGTLVAEVVAAGEPDADSTPGGGPDDEDDRASARLRVVGEEPAVRVRDVRVRERDRGERELLVRLATAPPAEAGSVAWRTEDGTATAGEDYAAASGRVELTGDDPIRIPIRGDGADEPDETVVVRLSDPDGVTLPEPAFTVTVVDDDDTPAPGDLRYLMCLSGDNGPIGSCPAADDRLQDPADVAAAPDGDVLYAADGRRIVVLARDRATTALTVRSCVTVGGAAQDGCPALAGPAAEVTDVAVSPDGRVLHAAATVSGAGPRVLTFDRAAGTGALSAGPAAVDAPAGSRLVLPPDGRQLYAIGESSGFGRTRVWTWTRDAATGALSGARCQVEGAVGDGDCDPLDVRLSSAMRTAFSPDGRSLYLRSADALALLSRDAATGALATGPCVRDGSGTCVPLTACASNSSTDQCPPPPIDEAAGVGGVAVSPDGATVTVTTSTFGLLRQYRRADDGDLRAVGCLQERGVDELLERDCDRTDAPLRSVGALANGAEARELHAAVAGGGVVTFTRVGDGLTAGRCTEPDVDGGIGCDGEADASGVADLVVPAGGEGVHALVRLRAVGGVTRSGVASYLRVRGGGTPAAPVCADGATSTKPGRTVTLGLRCADPGGQRLTLAVVGGPAHGTLGAVAGDGVAYTPEAGFRGEDRVTFRATAADGRVSGVAASRVAVADAAPVCQDVAVAAGIGQQRLLELRCSDEEGDPMTLSIVDPPAKGTLTAIDRSRTDGFSFVAYTSSPAGGDVSFTYRATDAGGTASVPATVKVAVPVPPPPAPRSGGGSGTGCKGSSCTSDGRSADWRYSCNGQAGSPGTCEGTVTMCPPRGLCQTPKRVGGHALGGEGAVASVAKARRGTPFAARRFKVRAGRAVTVRLRLSATARRTLRRRGRLRVRMVMVVRQPSGRVERTTRRVTYRYKPKARAAAPAGAG